MGCEIRRLMSCSFLNVKCVVGWDSIIGVPSQVDSGCYLWGKVRGLVGHTRHTSRSVSHGTFGLCDGPVWTVYVDTAEKMCGVIISAFYSLRLTKDISIRTDFNSPHAGAPVCPLVPPPPCLSIGRKKRKRRSWWRSFHKIWHKSWRDNM